MSTTPERPAAGDLLPDHPIVGIVMGSRSDWPTMQHAAAVLHDFGVPHETRVVSAHRTPSRLVAYAEAAADRGMQVLIAGAGGAAHLPGMLASMTPLPVLGVPVRSSALSGMDSLMSIVQMPKGIPVGTLAIGEPGAANAGLLAAQIVGLRYGTVRQAIAGFRERQTRNVPDLPEETEE